MHFEFFLFMMIFFTFQEQQIKLVNNLNAFFPSNRENFNKSFIEGMLSLKENGFWLKIHPFSLNQFETNLVCNEFGFSSGFLIPQKLSKNLGDSKYYELNCEKQVKNISECKMKEKQFFTNNLLVNRKFSKPN